jgi:hypothetical protein
MKACTIKLNPMQEKKTSFFHQTTSSAEDRFYLKHAVVGVINK